MNAEIFEALAQLEKLAPDMTDAADDPIERGGKIDFRY